MHFQMLLKNNAKNLNAFGGAKIILNFKNKSLKKQSISILQENPATHRLDIEKKNFYIFKVGIRNPKRIFKLY